MIEVESTGYVLVGSASLLQKAREVRDSLYAAGAVTGQAPDVAQVGEWSVVTMDPEHGALVPEFLAAGLSEWSN